MRLPEQRRYSRLSAARVISENARSFDTFTRKGQTARNGRLPFLSRGATSDALRLITESGTRARVGNETTGLVYPRDRAIAADLPRHQPLLPCSLFPLLCFYVTRETLNATLL